MKRTSSFLVIAVVLVNLLPICACARPQHERDVVYGMGYMAQEQEETPTPKPLLMDIMNPAGGASAPHPAAILIHGGGFERGSKEDERLNALAAALVEKGYACFLINYRLVRDNPPAPPPYEDLLSRAAHAAAVDAKTALRHLGANATEYDIDPKRIALVGSSAGAIAALAAGLSAPDRFLDDGIAYPVPQENLPGAVVRAAAIVNLWGTADFFPELFTPDAPPIMTVHGAKDFRVGLSLLPALNIDSYCREHGIPHHFYPIEDAGHGVWDAVVDGKNLHELVAAFLDTYLKP